MGNSWKIVLFHAHENNKKVCEYIYAWMQRVLSIVFVQKGVKLTPEFCLSLNQITPITDWPLQIAIIPWVKLKPRK